MRQCWCFLFLLNVCISFGQGRSASDRLVTITLPGGTIIDGLTVLEKATDEFSIAYSNSFFGSKDIIQSRSFENAPLSEILDYVLNGTDVRWTVVGDRVILSQKPLVKKYQLFGHVIDQRSKETIPHTVIYWSDKWTMTNELGEYRITIDQGEHVLRLSALGYKAKHHPINVLKDRKLDLTMVYDNILTDIVITEDSITPPSLHYAHYGYRYLQNLTLQTPGLGGTHDIMHTVRSIPGIQSGSGGIGGHYVRGSSNGENLYLLDGATIYYPYHALGLVSIFDPKFVSDMQVFKSGFRPKYGGRASSVVDVHIKEGSKDRWHAQSSMSLQAADAMVQGPMWGDKASLMAYGRRSIIGQSFSHIISQSLATDSKSGFNDLLLKYGHQVHPRHKLLATYYQGLDAIASTIDVDRSSSDQRFASIKWRNRAAVLRLQSSLSARAMLTMRARHSTNSNIRKDVTVNESADNNDLFFSAGSNNNEYGADAILNYYYDQNDFQLGWSSTYHHLVPTSTFVDDQDLTATLRNISDLDELKIENQEYQDHKVYSHALFAEGRWKVSTLKVDAGFRYSFFKNGQKLYHHIQPRLNADLRLDGSNSILLSLSRMVQYNHLLSLSSITLPQDVWIPSSDQFKPQSTWQVDLGWYRSLSGGSSISTNVYYKKSDNLIAYNSHLLDIESYDITRFFVQGSGNAYGVELDLSKKIGNIKGNVGYSYAVSDRDVNNFNLNKKYSFQFDRRHELKVLGSYQFTNELSIGTSLYWGTPNPRILVYQSNLTSGIDQTDRSLQGNKNIDRGIPAFRFDFSIQYDKKKKGINHHIKAGVYNATLADNPLFFYVIDDPDRSEPGFSLPVIPSVHYTISF